MVERLAKLLDRFRRSGYALFLIWILCFFSAGFLAVILAPSLYGIRSPWPVLLFPLLFLGAYLLLSVLLLKPGTKGAWGEVIALFIIGIPVSYLLIAFAALLFDSLERASRS